MNRLSIRAGAALLAGSLLAIGGGVAVSAQAVPAPVASETTTTLPLFGAPLTVDVTTAPGGAISAVTVDPADGLTASTVKPNKVKFVNEDGTARVLVAAPDTAANECRPAPAHSPTSLAPAVGVETSSERA